MTLASVSAPFHVKLHPVKLTLITDVLFFMALQITREQKNYLQVMYVNVPNSLLANYHTRQYSYNNYNTYFLYP